MFEGEYVHSRTEKFLIALLQALIAMKQWPSKALDEVYEVVTSSKIETITLYGVFAINLFFIILVASIANHSHPEFVAFLTSKLSMVKL